MTMIMTSSAYYYFERLLLRGAFTPPSIAAVSIAVSTVFFTFFAAFFTSPGVGVTPVVAAIALTTAAATATSWVVGVPGTFLL